jgi:hypothetical protein
MKGDRLFELGQMLIKQTLFHKQNPEQEKPTVPILLTALASPLLNDSQVGTLHMQALDLAIEEKHGAGLGTGIKPMSMEYRAALHANPHGNCIPIGVPFSEKELMDTYYLSLIEYGNLEKNMDFVIRRIKEQGGVKWEDQKRLFPRKELPKPLCQFLHDITEETQRKRELYSNPVHQTMMKTGELEPIEGDWEGFKAYDPTTSKEELDNIFEQAIQRKDYRRLYQDATLAAFTTHPNASEELVETILQDRANHGTKFLEEATEWAVHRQSPYFEKIFQLGIQTKKVEHAWCAEYSDTSPKLLENAYKYYSLKEVGGRDGNRENLVPIAVHKNFIFPHCPNKPDEKNEYWGREVEWAGIHKQDVCCALATQQKNIIPEIAQNYPVAALFSETLKPEILDTIARQDKVLMFLAACHPQGQHLQQELAPKDREIAERLTFIYETLEGHSGKYTYGKNIETISI